jgi:hypothetical protein
LSAGAGLTIANQVHHAPNCDQVDCHAAILLPEKSQSLIHACCGAHIVGQPQQEWLHLDKQPDRRQQHMPLMSIAVNDSSLQLQAPSSHISHFRKLQGIPYTVGAGRVICVPHEKPCCSHSTASHIPMHMGACEQYDQPYK